MESINFSKTTTVQESFNIGLSTEGRNKCLEAKVKGKETKVTNFDIDLVCTDRSERDVIEAFLKKHKFNVSSGMVEKKDFSVESRGRQGVWTNHVILHGVNAEKMLQLVCEMLEIKCDRN
jgi:hypothetical protein